MSRHGVLTVDQVCEIREALPASMDLVRALNMVGDETVATAERFDLDYD